MAYDAGRSRTVLFGGIGDAGGQNAPTLGDTWEWDGTNWKHVQDIGPAAATGAAMVFRSATSALFGGISALANGPGRKLFGLTWEWNGHLWTARQDIGVGARFDHAMAFDGTRGRVVLFGGRSAAADDPNADAGLKGDTWEHADAAAPPPPPDGGGGSTAIPVASIDATPNPVHAGQTLVFTIQLAAPAPPETDIVTLGGELLFGAPGTPTTIGVPAGQTTASFSVQIPQGIGNLSGSVTATSGGVTKSVTVQILQ
jgi:hypothetical protein